MAASVFRSLELFGRQTIRSTTSESEGPDHAGRQPPATAAKPGKISDLRLMWYLLISSQSLASAAPGVPPSPDVRLTSTRDHRANKPYLAEKSRPRYCPGRSLHTNCSRDGP